MKAVKNPTEISNLTYGDDVVYKYYGKFIQGTIVNTKHMNKNSLVTLKDVKTNLDHAAINIMGNFKIKRLPADNTWTIEILEKM